MQETLKQAAAVRENLGWFDRSGMGWLAVTGPDRYSWLQGMVSNDVRLLESGSRKRLPACLLDPTGHIIAEVTLLDFPELCYAARETVSEGFVMVETPPGMAGRVGDHLGRLLIMEDAEIRDVSEEFVCTTVQGPMLAHVEAVLRAAEEMALVVEADHTGSGGVDIYSPGRDELRVRRNLTHFVTVEVGAAAQELLRIEAGIPRYGLDMDDTTLAPEAGLMHTHISLNKGCYVGQEIVARIHSRGHTNRALTGLLILGETLPAAGERLYADDATDEGKEVGRVTSVAPVSPAAGGRPIAMGYVRHESRTPGTWLRLGAADSRRLAEVVELPFFPTPNRAAGS